jgi:Tol biopolymer transport system component
MRRHFAIAVVVVFALVGLAHAQPAEEENSVWPNTLPPDLATIEDRVIKMDGALEQLRGELSVLRNDLADNSGRASAPPRRNEPMFRGIYKVNRDGTNLEFLTAAPGMIVNTDPRYSHDGTMLAYGGVPEVDQPVKGKVYVVALSGPFKGRVRDFGYGNTPDWSPDDKQICYMINPGNPINVRGGTWIMNADGTERRWLTSGIWSRWSPDGKSILTDGSTLEITDLASGTTRPLLSAPGWQLKLYAGNWSPKSDKVTFVGTFDGKDRVATIDANGDASTIKIIATNEDPAAAFWGPPVFSPDGKQLVFPIGVPNRGGNRSFWHTYLYTVNADGTGEPKLLEGKKVGNINRSAAFSPDGETILFSSER